MNDIDYTAALMLLETLTRFQQQSVTVVLAQAGDVRNSLDRFGITEQVGAVHVFATVQEAVNASHPQIGAETSALVSDEAKHQGNKDRS